eukprot:Lithocolla_globosa_v1_NODE_2646_length_1921_cov_7.354234.p3 type:complete len:156 gc:universal NODE_2646_length_1921_cov_7.354234:1390-923(-)
MQPVTQTFLVSRFMYNAKTNGAQQEPVHTYWHRRLDFCRRAPIGLDRLIWTTPGPSRGMPRCRGFMRGRIVRSQTLSTSSWNAIGNTSVCRWASLSTTQRVKRPNRTGILHSTQHRCQLLWLRKSQACFIVCHLKFVSVRSSRHKATKLAAETKR